MELFKVSKVSHVSGCAHCVEVSMFETVRMSKCHSVTRHSGKASNWECGRLSQCPDVEVSACHRSAKVN